MSDVLLCRKEGFCAAHVLRSPSLSDQENKELFGPCSNPHGHGHNYQLEVVLKGPVDAQTGIVFNLTELKVIIQKHVLEKVDHRNLNQEVPEFREIIPTAENMAIVFWNWLSEALPNGLLYEVRLHETDKNSALYRGA